MKFTQFFLFMLFFGITAFAQNLQGTVQNEAGELLPGVFIKIEGTNIHSVSGNDGAFLIEGLKKGTYHVSVSMIGYETQTQKITVFESDIFIKVVLIQSDIIADEVVITALRANDDTPIAFTNIEKEDIEKNNQGQDIPYLLNMTPSLVVSSDAGTGIGYTSMRIRGTDMTRINVTLDGIPLNDAESHGVFWVNMPDFASSVDNIQIQRGVGTSTNGAAAFGANINFVTNLIEKEAFTNIDLSAGSFNTQKYTLRSGTGLLKDRFIFDARLSKIHSDGFVDRARTDIESFYLSGAFVNKKNFFKINVFRGHEETYQAWYGIPKDSLKTNRTYNPYSYDNEIDHYSQNHYQMFYTGNVSKSFDVNIAFHITQGEGYYEQYREEDSFAAYNLDDLIVGNDTIYNTDLIRRKWLDNIFYGTVYSLNYHRNNLNLVLGGSWNTYEGDHFGRIIWSEYASNSDIRYQWYFNKGVKKDLNEYIKVNYKLFDKLNLWADFQFRMIDYLIEGDHDDLRDISQEHSYFFFNPKAGFRYKLNSNNSAYLSFAIAQREPSRSNFRDADADEQFSPEKIYDFEAGYKFVNESAAINLNLYYMYYQDQLILTGEINDVGAYIMSNVPKSYRAGIELWGGIKITDFLSWNMNVAYSDNKIKDLTVYVDNWDTGGQDVENYKLTDISFSPDVIAGSELNFKLFTNLQLSMISKYVSRQYIDNTSNTDRSLDPYFLNNIRIHYAFKPKILEEIGISLYVNNVLNEEYETNAWVYRYILAGEEYEMNGYFPQAGIHFMAGLHLSF
jgi:iron complex outermembrane receptor protein